MKIFPRPYNSLDELHETELAYLELIADGNPVATTAALYYCVRHNIPIPPKFSDEAIKMLCAYSAGKAHKIRGRLANAAKRCRQHMIDYSRWSAVQEVRERRQLLRREIEQLRVLKGLRAKALLKQHEEWLKSLGTGDLDAFESATHLVASTVSKGKAEAIRKSYRRVEELSKDPIKGAVYHLLPAGFPSMIGADPEAKVRK